MSLLYHWTFFYFYYMILLNKKNLRKLKLVCLLYIIFMYRCIGSSPSPRGLGMTPWKKRRQRAYHKGINKNKPKPTNGTLTRCHTLYDLRLEVNFHLQNRSKDHSNKHLMIYYIYIVIFKHNILQYSQINKMPIS